MISSLRNVFGRKHTAEVSPLGSPHNPQHTGFSSHAQLQINSNSGDAMLSNEPIAAPDAPFSNEAVTPANASNPQYSPCERLASTSLLEDIDDSAVKELSQQSNAQQEALLMHHRQLFAAGRPSAAGSGNDIESCTSAASVAFASKSLAHKHQGVLIPQSQCGYEAPSLQEQAPPAHLQASEASKSSSAQLAEFISVDAPQKQQAARRAAQNDVEGAVMNPSAELGSTTSVEISPPSKGHTGTPLLPPRAASMSRGVHTLFCCYMLLYSLLGFA